MAKEQRRGNREAGTCEARRILAPEWRKKVLLPPLFCGLVFALLTSATAEPARNKTPPSRNAVTSKEPAAPSDAEYKSIRARDEARQREWDRKMKALSGSICTGC